MTKNRILLLLAPIIAAIPIGLFGCGFFVCYATIPPLLIIAFSFILFIVIKLFEENKLSVDLKILYISLIPLYMLGILFLVYMVMIFSLDFSSYQSWMKFNNRGNPLIENGDTYVYKNSDYHYQIQIPKDWGFISGSTSQGVTLHPSGKENYINKTEIRIVVLPPNDNIPSYPHDESIEFHGHEATLNKHDGIYSTTIDFDRESQRLQIEILSQSTPLREKYLDYIKNAFAFTE